MQSLLLRTGGRPFAYDDLEVLQNLALAGTRLFGGLPNCVVSGCQLTPSGSTYDVAPGVLWLDGELRDFPGRASVTLPALFQAGNEVKSDSRVHTLTTLNLPCLREQNAELVDYDTTNPPSRRPLLLTANGPLMWWHRMQEKTRTVGVVEWLASYSAADYDASGVGIGAAWGWALCDGRGGRADLGGRVAIGRDEARPDYDTVGKVGGSESVALTVPQLPAHSHGVEAYSAYTNNTGATLRKGDRDNSGPVTFQSSTTGGNQAHENRQPYRVLLARLWVGFN